MQDSLDEELLDQVNDSMGSLDDLPPELANTVANVYYRFHQAAAGGMDGMVDRFMSDGLEGFIGQHARIVADTKMVSSLAEDLSQIDKVRQPNLYRYAVDLTLDILKYRIPNAHQKSGLRRMIERKFREGSVDEIPNLLEILRQRQGNT